MRKNVLTAWAAPFFPLSLVLLNKHPSVSADWCWFGEAYRDTQTPAHFPGHSSRPPAAASGAWAAKTAALHMRPHLHKYFPNKCSTFLYAVSKMLWVNSNSLHRDVFLRPRKIKSPQGNQEVSCNSIRL